VPILLTPWSPTSLPLGGVMGLFWLKKGWRFHEYIFLDTLQNNITQLTLNIQIHSRVISPNGAQMLFTGFGLTNKLVGLINGDGTDPIGLSEPNVDEGFPYLVSRWATDRIHFPHGWQQ
jgi:hypothetical protein